MNRSLAALTLALLVGFGSATHSSSSEITDTYPVDCELIIRDINYYHEKWTSAEKFYVEKMDELSATQKSNILQRNSALIKKSSDLSNLYVAFCK